jgi:hypothetical protein
MCRQLQGRRPAQPRRSEQVRPGAGPALVQQAGVQALTEAAAVLGQRLCAAVFDRAAAGSRPAGSTTRAASPWPADGPASARRVDPSSRCGGGRARLAPAAAQPAAPRSRAQPVRARPNASRSSPRSPPPQPGPARAQPSGPGSPDRLGSAPPPPAHCRDRAQPLGKRACGCRSPRTTSRTSSR